MVMGNEAVVQGALAAGCDFFAGYPITPATEILEEMARQLPARGGVFLQMEDELAAMAAVIGAAWGGARAMTATSGPGFSLMQEHIGYAAMTQTPCVVVDAQRAGPSTGLPTLPAQGDVMQARYGSHGDRPAIVLTVSSVKTAYWRTRQAFDLAERHRLPVIVLLDAVVAHMREPLELPPLPPPAPRSYPLLEPQAERFGTAPFVPFGEGPPVVVTGLSHDRRGLPRTGSGRTTEEILREATARLEEDPELAEMVTAYRTEDARILVVAYGITARVGRAAVDTLRAQGVAAGLLDLHVLWPLPVHALLEAARGAEAVVVAELNLGQMVLPIRAALAGWIPVHALTRADGHLFAPEEVAEFVSRLGAVGRGPGGRKHA